MNRALSGRRSSVNHGRRRFSISTFRGLQQPLISKKMNRMIKGENAAIAAHESAARQRILIAAQLSEWGETTDDQAVSDITDKLGVLMSEMGEQEDVYAQNLEEYRSALKHIRDTESSVQPTRDQRAKLSDEIQRLKIKEPHSHKIETMEQELVRAEAQNLVAEAQLTNVTRQRLKEAYNIQLAAVIERNEKQILLARHARRLLNCLDDTSVVPGDEPKAYARGDEAKQIIEDAERELHSWESNVEPIESSAGARAEQPNTSLPSSAREIREEGAIESQITDSRGEMEETQTEDPSIFDEEPRVAERDMAAPNMDANTQGEREPTAMTRTADDDEGRMNERAFGDVGEGQRALASSSTQNQGPSLDNFAIRTKRAWAADGFGGALDTQVQRTVVPI
ncbi:Eisosome component PIL1-domain-containing protein [Aspergillus californicus]